MLSTVASFVGELRAWGMAVSPTEHGDAAAAVGEIGPGDRGALRHALAATLVKRSSNREAFDIVFDLWFPMGGDPGTEPDELGTNELAELIRAALHGDELARDRAVAAVTAGVGSPGEGRPLGPHAHLHRALRRLDLEGAVATVLAGAGWRESESLQAHLARHEVVRRADMVAEAVETAVRRRLVAERGAEALGRSLRSRLPEDMDFMHATREDMARLQRTLQPLARRLAVRMGRRRRHRRQGPLDFRATLRRSLGAGGVPVETRYRPRHPSRPELVVLADLSGSVAAFARFTLQLVHALSGQFSAVRSFAFIDEVDEVTSLFAGGDDLAGALRRVNADARILGAEGHSDYGVVWDAFWSRYGRKLGGRATLLVLGDARSNYHPSGEAAFAQVAWAARRVHWLNPEPRAYWDNGDSVMGEYAPHCDGVHECRNLRQLERFVEALA